MAAAPDRVTASVMTRAERVQQYRVKKARRLDGGIVRYHARQVRLSRSSPRHSVYTFLYHHRLGCTGGLRVQLRTIT